MGRPVAHLKLGLNTGYWSAGPPDGAAEAVAEAEKLGFDSIWTAEAYGSDVLTPLAWWGAATRKLQLGTAIMQMSARTPGSGGDGGDDAWTTSRAGASSWGWACPGRRWWRAGTASRSPSRWQRTREYVAIVRRHHGPRAAA